MSGIWISSEEVAGVGMDIARMRGESLVRLVWRGEKAHISAYLPSLIDLVEKEKPSAVIFPSQVDLNDLAAGLASALNCPFISGCIKVAADETGLEAQRHIYGGAAVQVVRSDAWPVVLTLVGGERVELEGVEIKEVFPVSQTAVKVLERKVKESANRPITEAKVVISIGRGFKRREDIVLVKDLAARLSGEIGCTRPIASELHWLPESVCIGLSGVQVSPDLYLALGISGQVQHVVGIRGARVIVAVNQDEKAPIFGVADFGIVGDLYNFIPLFLEALKGTR
ncbi:MAG: electron transfer flavoprotein subunit alpha/FixB family protein [Syntrophales bacterium]|nr:electron transfer flavoprotein subunit alpha/FixB family protein [Syntrophales bacterium]